MPQYQKFSSTGRILLHMNYDCGTEIKKCQNFGIETEILVISLLVTLAMSITQKCYGNRDQSIPLNCSVWLHNDEQKNKEIYPCVFLHCKKKGEKKIHIILDLPEIDITGMRSLHSFFLKKELSVTEQERRCRGGGPGSSTFYPAGWISNDIFQSCDCPFDVWFVSTPT